MELFDAADEMYRCPLCLYEAVSDTFDFANDSFSERFNETSGVTVDVSSSDPQIDFSSDRCDVEPEGMNEKDKEGGMGMVDAYWDDEWID